MTDALLVVLLTVVAILGTLVVATREPVRQVIVVGVFGLALALLFFAVQAPDVGLSQLVVGSVALPAMLLLAIAKVREEEAEFEDEEEGER